MTVRDDPRYARIQETLEAVAELKIPPHLEAIAFEYLLSPPSSETQQASRSLTAVAAVSGNTTSDLRAFVASTKPASSVSEIPALLYWARINEGKESVNERDVIELYRRAGMRPPKDVSQSFRDLCKKKYFRLEPVEGARGNYRLSRAGEDYVLHDLIAGSQN